MKKECTEQYQKTKIKFHIKISINRKNIQYNIHDKKWIKLTDQNNSYEITINGFQVRKINEKFQYFQIDLWGRPKIM